MTLLLFVTTAVTFVMWQVDLAILSSRIGECTSCSTSMASAPVIAYAVPTLIVWIGTAVSIVAGLRLRRSPSWVPLAAIIIVIAAYLASRALVYATP